MKLGTVGDSATGPGEMILFLPSSPLLQGAITEARTAATASGEDAEDYEDDDRDTDDDKVECRSADEVVWICSFGRRL